MLILADRLKITLKQVLDMTEVEYNLWIGFLMLEKDEYDRVCLYSPYLFKMAIFILVPEDEIEYLGFN